jgi:hypothetical protein
MNLEERFEAIFEDFEYRSYNMLVEQATYFFDRLYNCLEAYEYEKTIKTLASVSMIICSIDGEANRTEYDFFHKVTRINLHYEDFKRFGMQFRNSEKAKSDIKQLGRSPRTSEINNALNIYALCLCACDGKFTKEEKEFCKKYIPHPGLF